MAKTRLRTLCTQAGNVSETAWLPQVGATTYARWPLQFQMIDSERAKDPHWGRRKLERDQQIWWLTRSLQRPKCAHDDCSEHQDDQVGRYALLRGWLGHG